MLWLTQLTVVSLYQFRSEVNKSYFLNNNNKNGKGKYRHF